MNPSNEEALQRLLREFRSGYLKEETLERAIVNIARHYAKRGTNQALSWQALTLCVLLALIAAGAIGSALGKPLKELPASPATVPASKFDPLEIAAPYLIDNSPPGSYDFTLLRGGSDAVGVPAPCAGKVLETNTDGDGGGYGNWVELACLDQRWFFAHLASADVKAGQAVAQGQSVGVQGSTGRSTGPHVHAEIHTLAGERIENRAKTAPIIQRYLDFLKAGQR